MISKKGKELKTAVFLAMILSLFLLGLNDRDLWTPDEPRVAEIGREMAETGNYVVPMLNGRPFLEQPPLFYASLAVVFKIAGKATDGLARIPSALYGLAGVFATYLIASTLFGRRVGLISTFVLATSFEYFRVARWVIVDSALSCFIYFAIWAFIRAYFGGDEKKLGYYLLFYIFITLAFFVKGFVGIGVPAVSIFAFLLMERNLKEIKKMYIPLGIGLFVICAGIWTFELYKQGGIEHLRTFYVDNNLMRFLPGGTSGHHHPFYYYFREFPPGFFPWVLLLVPALFYSFSKDLSYDTRKLLFLKCYFISGFVLFSFASTKRILYLLPIFAPASIMVAVYIEHLIESGMVRLMEKIFLWIYGLLYLATGFSLSPLTLYIAQKYGIRVETINLLSLFCTSCALTVLSIFALISLNKKKIKRFFIVSSFCLFIVLMFLLLWVSPYVNEHKSFKPFVREVLNQVPRCETIYAYKPDETIRGFFPFYSGIYLNEINDVHDLPVLSKKRGACIVVRDKDRRLSTELENEGFVQVFNIQRDPRGSLALFRVR